MKTITFIDGTSIAIESFSLNKNMNNTSTVLIIRAVGGQDVFNQFSQAVTVDNCATLTYKDDSDTENLQSITLEGFNSEASVSLAYNDDQKNFFVDVMFYKEEV